jgi:hypothetical protein
MAYAFNDAAHSIASKAGAPITDDQLAFAKAGKYIDFWKSRWLDSGDPVARIALIGWGQGDLVGASWSERVAARFTWHRLNSYIESHNLTVSMDQIGKDEMLAHIDAVTNDSVNIPHLLSPAQVAQYHWDSFRAYGIPSSIFGGTMYGLGPNAYSGLWCSGCDTKP